MADEMTSKANEFGFFINAAPGWSVIETETSEPAPGARWSLVLTAQDGAEGRRLGVFVSLDPAKLFEHREWAMALEQEFAKVRHRASRFLKTHHKLAAATAPR